jgi:hypothetical protein
LISSSDTGGLTGAAIPGITLASYGPSTTVLDIYEFASNITGTHHIEIERDLQGKFKVSYDSQVVIQFTDNTASTSERFGFLSFKGDSVSIMSQ